MTRRPKKSIPTALIIRSVLQLAVITVAIRTATQKLWESFFVCILAFILFLTPSFIEKKFRITLPTGLEITIFLFIFAAEILGEIECYYMKYSFWDTMLHTVNGFVFSAFGFSLVDLLCQNKRMKFRLSPAFLTFTAFCFSMTIGTLWEFFEFGMDHLFALDMQKDTIIYQFRSVALNGKNGNLPIAVTDITQSILYTADGSSFVIDGYLDIGLTDTIKDLFVNFIGAAVFSVPGWFYVKRRGNNAIAAAFIPTIREESSGIPKPHSTP